ncbi:hypothetical protein BCR33DRAFT_781262 [Rhizoclosmatium globosum]|uniref:Uncharacterized protein n=1 Tax=Rhizoclosmatium globosum TaxID=329046 RepID=A0A1Y2CU55_9FUNG|nr:hypothetical protein BCR33DRAFT_781262 [Rhizoclosmatium globosum]|eukprot:ORY50561.1 hypothetical protein BCR33DRAFT_781262 [Rhizoclosmatium globosum]
MIPRYALGSWSSRYWAYNEAEFLRVVQTYHQNRVPLDVLVVDMDWHKTFYAVNGGQWTGWTWDPLLFSDARRFLSVLKEMGIRVTVNLHPADGVMAHEDVYPEMARRLGVFRVVIGNIEKDGIEFFWLDWQQGESWQKWTGIDGLNPTLWLNYVFWKHSELAHPSFRPLNFHRWGGLGNHRYPIGFSGDTFPSWEMLTSQIKFTVTSSNVLFGYWSHDLGGHMTTSEPELYTRWVQFGAWSPIFRTHSTKSGNNVRYFWKYPRGESEGMTRAVYGRMELLPYSYSMVKVAHDCGVSLLRPLYYEFPEMEEAYLRGSEYYFGDLFVVAPIAKAVDANGLVEVDLWVPPGEWLEMGTGKVLNGPFVHSGHYLLEDVPVLVKSGAIVPKSLMDDTKYFGLASEIPRHLVIEIFMGQALNGNFSLYEDDGLTSDYDNPERQMNTHLTYKREEKDIVSVSITPENGVLSGISGRRAYRLKFLQTVGIKSVQVNAVDIDCSKLCAFRSQEMAAYVDIGEFEIDQKLDIVVQFSSPLTQVPDGLLVKKNRMLKAKEMLDNQWELEEPYIYQDYYASLLKSLSFIQAAEFNPLEAGEFLKKADALYGNVVAEVAQIVEGRGEALGYILDILTKL